jgi:hypothetical protein
VTIWSRHGGGNQQWQFQLDPETDTYFIRSYNNQSNHLNLIAHFNYLSENNNRRLHFVPEPTDEARWIVTRSANGNFHIINARTGNFLDVLNARIGNGTVIQSQRANGDNAQDWHIEVNHNVDPHGLSGNVYAINSLGTLGVIDLNASHSDITPVLYPWNNEMNQQFMVNFNYQRRAYQLVSVRYPDRAITIDVNLNPVLLPLSDDTTWLNINAASGQNRFTIQVVGTDRFFGYHAQQNTLYEFSRNAPAGVNSAFRFDQINR